MGGDVEVHDPPSIVRKNQEHAQDLKPDGRDGEEVDRHHGLDVILEECPPVLRRRLPTVRDALADAGLADIDAEFEQFAFDAGCANSGFSRLLARITFRTSLEIGGRPGRPWRTFQVQYSRKPLRCQPITVSGLK